MSTERPGERLPFDDEIDRAWRRHADEQPPERVNAAILAAARKPRARLTGWQPLAAAATVAALAFLLVQLMPRERSVEQPISVEPALPPTTAAVAPTGTRTAPPAQASVGAPARDVGSASAESRAKVETSPVAEGPTGAPAPAEAAPQVSPQQWATRIEQLYESGDVAAAASELRRFRAARADADTFLPDSLRDWASAIH